jgi:hypothetical protein
VPSGARWRSRLFVGAGPLSLVGCRVRVVVGELDLGGAYGEEPARFLTLVRDEFPVWTTDGAAPLFVHDLVMVTGSGEVVQVVGVDGAVVRVRRVPG